MITHTRETLSRLKELFPQYDASRGYELAGMVFFQGWNDMVDGSQREEKYAMYTQRLATLIKDMRRDLKAPNLPVVIGELGANGERGDFQAAQQAVADLPEFQGTVTCVKTCEFWEPDVAEMVRKNVWRGPDWVTFYNVGSERGYHYLGSARIFMRMGQALFIPAIKPFLPLKDSRVSNFEVPAPVALSRLPWGHLRLARRQSPLLSGFQRRQCTRRSFHQVECCAPPNQM